LIERIGAGVALRAERARNAVPVERLRYRRGEELRRRRIAVGERQRRGGAGIEMVDAEEIVVARIGVIADDLACRIAVRDG